LDIVITELSASGVAVHKNIADKQHTIWKVWTPTDSATKPPWRYRHPRKPIEETIPPNPNTIKYNRPPRKTHRSIRQNFEHSMVTGKSEIASWRRGAGRSKAWRRYRGIEAKEFQTEEYCGSKSYKNVSTVPWPFSTSEVPLSLLRTQGKKPIQGEKRQISQRKPLEASGFTVKHVKEKKGAEMA
jgi:hypothetical protein